MNEKRETDGKREVGRLKYLLLVNKKWIDRNEKEKSMERGRLGGLNIEQNVASGKSFQT